MRKTLVSSVALVSLSALPAASATMADCTEQYAAITTEQNDILMIDTRVQTLQEAEKAAAEEARNAEQDINYTGDLETVERLRNEHDLVIAQLKDLALERDMRSRSVNEKIIVFNNECVTAAR